MTTTSKQPPAGVKPLMDYRRHFPILDSTTYLNSNSMGAMPAAAKTALAEYVDLWAKDGAEAWDHWLPMISEIADHAGRFFGAAPGETILNQNVSWFMNLLGGCFEYTPKRNKVVMAALDFPTLHYVWQRYESRGAKLALVPSDDTVTIPTERICSAIDESTVIVVISHSYFVSSALVDVPAIVKKARSVGAYICLDGYQTVGLMPLDVKALDVDFFVAGSHKWLCGGPGTCFLYAKPEIRDRFEPLATGWFAHRKPFSFEPPPIKYAEGIWRFMGGTPSIPGYYVAREAYKIIEEVGVARIREHNLQLTQQLIDGALERGLRIHTPTDPDKRAGFVAIDFDGADKALHTLINERFKLDYRPKCGLRLGPHFYNTEVEVERFLNRAHELAGAR
jgi:kynureninase